MSPRTVLLIANIFPPSRFFEIAAERPAKFLKYLPAYGWAPIVITRYWDDNSVRGPHALPADMPTIKDWQRTLATPESATALHPDHGAIVKVPFNVTRLHKMHLRLQAEASQKRWLIPARKISSLLQFLSPNYTGTDWLKQVRSVALEITKTRKVDVIVATAPPIDTLWFAHRLARELKVPWVADLRDRVFDMFHTERRIARLYLRRTGRILRQASSVIVVSDELARSEMELLQLQRMPSVIPNGFDVEDYKDIHVTHNTTFEICYTGTLYPTRQDPETFIRGFKKFVDGQSVARDKRDILFRYMGRSSELITFLSNKYGLKHEIEDEGHVSRQHALERQANCNVLLHLTDCTGVQGIATGKIYEYLAARRPILAVPGDRSTVDRILTSTQAGLVASTSSEVAGALDRFYQEWATTGTVGYYPNDIEVSKYARHHQSQRLATILSDITS